MLLGVAVSCLPRAPGCLLCHCIFEAVSAPVPIPPLLLSAGTITLPHKLRISSPVCGRAGFRLSFIAL